MIRTETIQLHALRIGYRRREGEKVLGEGMEASIRSGELTCLLGQNGVGKSTLLRTLSGFQRPLGGTVTLLGKALGKYTDDELSRRLGVVLTDKCDVTNMTVEDLVSLGRAPYTGFWGRLSGEDRRVVEDSMQTVGIAVLAGRKVETLSDGERQKVMIAKALAQQTEVIFLDEPTAFLDYPSKVEMMQLLHRLTRERGKTVFMSTHDLELALQIADRLWLMKRGAPLRTGTPEDLAMDGSLKGFFTGRGVAFDPTSGLFRIANRYRRGVRLTGTGIPYAMAAKALRRIGVNPDDRHSDCSVEAGRTFTIRRGTGCVVCASIADLLECFEKKIFTGSE